MTTLPFPAWVLAAGLALLAAPVAPPTPAPGPRLPRAGQQLYRRYVGEVAGQPVLVELNFRRLDGMPKDLQLDLFGGYYPLATGVARDLRPVGLLRPAAPLALAEPADSATRRAAVWRATQSLGPVLSGTWQGADSLAAPQPFSLREDYTGAVRYELLEEGTTGGRGLTAFGEPARSSVLVQYLHLLGPDTLRPALARLQCPGPARRRRERQQQGQVTSPQDFATNYALDLTVSLNEQDLLEVNTRTISDVVNHHRDDYTWDNAAYDLRTGQRLDLLALLKPGGEDTVQRLLTDQLRAHAPELATAFEVEDGLLPLPDEGFALTPAGWEATYLTNPADQPYYEYTVQLTWAQLRPLLRPGTPLNRLLVARGLPPVQ